MGKGGGIMQETGPVVVAHRCNSLDKIRCKGKFTGWLEIDLMHTRDRKLVVGHPADFQAIHYMWDETGRYNVHVDGALPLSFIELAGIIREYDLQVFLDLKYENMGEMVAREIVRLGLVDRVVVISWGQENLVAVNNVCKEIRTGWIFKGALIDPVGDLERLGCQFLITAAYYLTDGFLVKLRQSSKRLNLCIHCIKEACDAREAARLGVVFILADISESYWLIMREALGTL